MVNWESQDWMGPLLDCPCGKWRRQVPLETLGGQKSQSLSSRSCSCCCPPDLTLLCHFCARCWSVFLKADNRILSINLKSDKVELICKDDDFRSVVPYMSFYSPVMG
ncbi:hypothetical protein SEVIR_5G047825v4 [Setaria viridis]|uniref:Uncharacterized protein n=1 Tax=Setaria viridis TaxID=4556 RepID=A0A4U6UP97_SETVI|nr:hypothetical protein SEVIR_5G047825v2 [Setaria viridis]